MPRKKQHADATPAEPGSREAPSDYFDDAWVEIFPEPGLASATARALLDAATHLGYDEQRAVVSITGGFRVPQDVIDAAELPTDPDDGRHAARTPLAALDQGATPDTAPAGGGDTEPPVDADVTA